MMMTGCRFVMNVPLTHMVPLNKKRGIYRTVRCGMYIRFRATELQIPPPLYHTRIYCTR